MEKMTFLDIDYRLKGVASAIIRLARSWSEEKGFNFGYSKGKALLSVFVGYGSKINGLDNAEAYEIVRKELEGECKKGDNIYRER